MHASPVQVGRDLAVRRDPLTSGNTVEQEAWRRQASSFLRGARGEADATKGTELPAKRKPPERSASYDHVITLDHMLRNVIGHGLLLFSPKEEATNCQLLLHVCGPSVAIVGSRG